MKFIVVLALIAIAYGEQLNCWKSYNANDGSYYSLQGGWYNGTDQNGHVWYFSTCTNNEVPSLCLPTKEGEYVSVCQEIKGITYPKGTFASMQFSDSPYGSDQGVEIMYGVESIKTVVELVCADADTQDSITVKVVDDSTTVITFNSQDNCPMTVEILDMDEPQIQSNEEERTIVIPGAFVYFFFLCTSLLCVCCCCTCIMRRRRCQQRKDIQMKQFSSVAFQPIPANTARTTATAPQANLNPYVAQPQFVYYYPSQNGNVQEFPFAPYTQPAVELETQNDEVMARNLQAQFDQEHV